MASNYSSVLDQLRGHGLIVNNLIVGRMQRCKVDGDREKRGWYILHELSLSNGDLVLVGSYGIWHGSDNGAMKVEFDKSKLNTEQRSAILQRMKADQKRAELERKRSADLAAKKADAIWRRLSNDGDCDYLQRKKVPALGVRFTDKNSLCIPMMDISGRIYGLQFILDRTQSKERIQKIGRDKEFWPAGMAKKGRFHLIGLPTNILLVAEGYATAASLNLATGLPVAVAFDANNIDPVISDLKRHYRGIKILICADNDSQAICKHCKTKIDLAKNKSLCPDCGQEHGKINTGIDRAGLASLAHGCAWVAPRFEDENARFEHFAKNQGKLTDFNDLHLQEGLHSVRVQIEHAIAQQGWRITSSRAGASEQGGGESKKEALRPISSAEELLERYSLVYGMGGMLFDHQERIRVAINDMKQACVHSDIPKRWQESKERSIVRSDEVGFDPTGRDSAITCNTWDGWPTSPKSGSCERLLELLEYMCQNDGISTELYSWMLKWLAYPIQHPGAKMKTALVIHGPQGTGKNLFFDQILVIYGKYGRIIDQSAVEDKFNDCFSGKLFMIADEVVARSDLYHIKNKLKGLITGDRIRINPKNMAAYEEKNHVNLVFLSNERMPVVLEEDDRRHTVIWTPKKLGELFYAEVAAEITNGGTEALHDYLLNLNLGDFNEHTKPPMTTAKSDLIHLSKDSITRFYEDWTNGDLEDVPIGPALTEDVYDLYRLWCGREGVRIAPKNKAIDAISKRNGARKERKRLMIGTTMSNPKMILIPHNAEEMNLGNSESAWLGKCVENFKLGVTSYKGGSYD